MRELKIILACEGPLTLGRIRKYCENLGHSVTGCKSYSEYKKCIEGRFDALISGITFCGYEGNHIAEKARKKGVEHIIFFSYKRISNRKWTKNADAVFLTTNLEELGEILNLLFSK